MRTLWFAVLALTVVQDRAAAPPPQDFDALFAAALKRAADAHARLGRFCEGKKQRAWARTQFERALECDPDHAEAKRLLAREGIEWTNATRQEPEEPGDLFEECAKKAYEVFQPAGAAFRDAAKWADDQGGDAWHAQALRAWKLTIEYWPACAEARKRLGHEQWKWDFGYGSGRVKAPKDRVYLVGPPRWSHAGEVAFRKEFEERKAKAPKAKPYKCEDKSHSPAVAEVEGTFYVFMLIGVDAKVVHLDEFAATCEAFTSWLHDFVEAKERIEGRVERLPLWPIHACISVDEVVEYPVEIPFHHRNTFGRGLRTVIRHSMDSYLHGRFIGRYYPMAWLHLWTLLYFTKVLFGHGMATVDDATTSPDMNSHVIRAHEAFPGWHKSVREHVWLGDDPPINASIGQPVNSMRWRSRLKGWSLFDFLMTEHRPKLTEFFKQCDYKVRDPMDPTGEKTFLKVFGWSREELDSRWRRFVLENY
jgi:hypothetical protein